MQGEVVSSLMHGGHLVGRGLTCGAGGSGFQPHGGHLVGRGLTCSAGGAWFLASWRAFSFSLVAAFMQIKSIQRLTSELDS